MQLGALGVYLLLLLLQCHALRTLVGGVLAHEAQTAEHLAEVVGGEDEHELALYGVAAVRHIAQTLHVACLALIQLRVELVELCGEHADVAVDASDIAVDGVDGLLVAVHVGADALQVLQLLLHLRLVGPQCLLLLAYGLLDARLFVLQPPDGAVCRRRRLGGLLGGLPCRFSGRSSDGSLFLGRRLLLRLTRREAQYH